MGNGVTVSNVQFNNMTTTLTATTGGQLGVFTNNPAVFPAVNFTSGLIIATGDVSVAVGPNDAAGSENAIYNSMTCPELESMIYAGIYNPAVLEFDFMTTADMVTFNYVFASEEYPEFVNAGFNDGFGFFVTDLTTNQTTNVARIPNTSIPVTIDNVNAYSYSQYYHETPDYSNNIQYDACIGPLAATFAVVPCRMYHMKLAIANSGDEAYGSAVFLQAQSFSADATDASLVYDMEDMPIVVQDCNTATVTFAIPEPIGTNTVIPLTVTGTAVNGTDVQTLPSAVTIPAGQTTASFVVRAIGDYTPDTLVLNISYESSVCADATTITVLICKNQGVEITSHNVNFCQPVDSIGVQLVSGVCSEINWTPSEMLSDPHSLTTGFLYEYDETTQFQVTASDPFHCTTSTTTFNYIRGIPVYDTIRASICEGQPYFGYGFNESEEGTYTHNEQTALGCDSITTLILSVFAPEVEITVGETDLCEDGYVDLTAVSSTDNLHWTGGNADGNVLHVTTAGTYSVRAVDGPCTAQDFVTIEPCPDADIYVPSCITPTNHDGLNDEFQVYIASTDIVEFEILIYDRWGHLVFQSTDPHFHWDGSVKGKFLSNSTLTYRMVLKTKWHNRRMYTGSITIL